MIAHALPAAIAIGGTCAATAALVAPKRPSVARRVRPYLAPARGKLGKSADPLAGLDPQVHDGVGSVIIGPLRSGAKWLGRRLESRTDVALERALYQAGRKGESPNDVRLQQVSRGGATAFVLGVVAIVLSHAVGTAVAAAMCGFVAGSARVRGRLERDIAQRTDRMNLELYTVNQMLALYVRSGAGPMQAVQRVVDRCSGAVIEELDAVMIWVRSGQREADAFRRAAELTPCAAAGRTYQMFALAVERGSDLGAALLAVGDDLRDERRESLRKHAIRQRAAMLAPTIGVLAPIMLLFVAAPLPSIVLGGR